MFIDGNLPCNSLLYRQPANYSKLPSLSLQAIKELKAENDTLKLQLMEQQKLTAIEQEMAAIKQLLCHSNPQADLCKAKSLK